MEANDTTDRQALPATAVLAKRIARLTDRDGVHATPVPRLHIIRSAGCTEDIHAVHEPALCIVVQGAKRVLLGDRVFEYDEGRHLVVSFDLPIIGQIVRAEPYRPYLCLRLDIGPEALSDLAHELRGEGGCISSSSGPGLALGRTTAPMLDVADRLVRLVEEPEDIATLAPLYERELLYRVASTSEGRTVLARALGPGRGPQVARAIAWIKANYRAPFDMAHVAEAARLQPSALHQHFKAITLLSPLQYHKRLRLQEARRLMLFGERNAASAAFAVGYESPSQFSREYRRQFGRPPMEDVATTLDAQVIESVA